MWLWRIFSRINKFMDSNSKCWNCGYSYNGFKFFCSKCNKIQKPIEIDSFKIFNLKYDYLINLDDLEIAYYLLQSKLHPDKFINGMENEVLFSQIHSSNLNNAYQILTDIVKRADELLKCLGLKLESNNSFNDVGVLAEVMELQEELENITNVEQKKTFKEKILNKVNKIEDKLNEAFNNRKLDEAESLKVQISYLIKILNNI